MVETYFPNTNGIPISLDDSDVLAAFIPPLSTEVDGVAGVVLDWVLGFGLDWIRWGLTG